MRAVRLRWFGGPDALETIELPDPYARDGEVRIRLRAAVVNPAAALVRNSGAAAAFAASAHIPGMT